MTYLAHEEMAVNRLQQPSIIACADNTLGTTESGAKDPSTICECLRRSSPGGSEGVRHRNARYVDGSFQYVPSNEPRPAVCLVRNGSLQAPTRTSLRDHPPREYSDSSSLHPHDTGAAASRCLAGPGRYLALLVQIAAAWALSTADLATDRVQATPPRPPPAVRTVWSRSERPRPRVAVCTPDTAWGALSQSPPHRGGGAPTR